MNIATNTENIMEKIFAKNVMKNMIIKLGGVVCLVAWVMDVTSLVNITHNGSQLCLVP